MATTPTLDLGALDMLDDQAAPSPASPVAKPVRAPLDLFFEDPNQPRSEFDEVALKAFAEEIKERKVQTPINVRPPLPDGRMMVIHGARRLRASRLAGVPDIPYLIQEDEKSFDDYSQVAENQQRENLTPRELARFIQKRMDAGESQTFVAKKLGLAKSLVTWLLTLINGPDFVVSLYDSGKCRTPQYLYDLANLAKDQSEAVEAFCNTSDDFSRNAIQAFATSLKGSSVINNNSTNSGQGSDSGSLSGLDAAGSGGQGNGSPGGSADDEGEGDQGNVTKITGHNPDIEKKGGKQDSPSDPSKIKKPLLLGRVGKRDVMVMLYKRPTTPGLVFVKYEDGSGEDEVEFGQVKNMTLTESVL